MTHHLYLYSEVNDEIVEDLIREIHAINEEFLDKAGGVYNYVNSQINKGTIQYTGDLFLEPPKDEEILLHINSGGGYVSSGLALINAIKSSEIPINTIVDGQCLSMAFIIFICGSYRYCYKSSTFMHHPTSYGLSGSFNQHKAELMHAEKLNYIIDNIIEENTLLDRKYLDEVSSEVYWYGYEDTVYDEGIVDCVIDKDVTDVKFDRDCELCENCEGDC